MQDENIKGWHKGLFGRQVQNSALGTLKAKLKSSDNVLIIDRFFPSTMMCPECGVIKEDITLSDRTFICDTCGYTEERDITCVLKFRGKSSAKPGQTSSMRFLSLAFSRLETSVGERM